MAAASRAAPGRPVPWVRVATLGDRKSRKPKNVVGHDPDDGQHQRRRLRGADLGRQHLPGRAHQLPLGVFGRQRHRRRERQRQRLHPRQPQCPRRQAGRLHQGRRRHQPERVPGRRHLQPFDARRAACQLPDPESGNRGLDRSRHARRARRGLDRSIEQHQRPGPDPDRPRLRTFPDGEFHGNPGARTRSSFWA